ncbi:bifunctional adenosylcobinamide kinase/adenosylcobinamide-phosphate guanylyltransferase [Moraxella sp. ZJ142]|uniref:bifunctional adenosylcobinamide kinase/adenosylcobinamide-phosphate guanylyltransferase n=1 Tax=Moraxella marmotae TaxID=3344520 RepID=UPI0035D48C05
MLYFVLGGARSGKSRHAQQLAAQAETAGKQVIYVATATASDDEMAERIKHHQHNRPSHWQVVEEPLDLAGVLSRYGDDCVILVDCLTLWLSNLLGLPDESQFAQHRQAFIQALTTSRADVVLVSNETGLGIVPMGQLTRQFVDESGFLHQQIAQLADQVVFCVAGLPMVLK